MPLTFENFIVGPSNRVVYAAARTVAEQPGRRYNPLVIVGPSGSGKTHLLQGVLDYLTVHRPELRTRMHTGAQLARNLDHSLRHGQRNLLHLYERGVGCHLIDDSDLVAVDRYQETIFSCHVTHCALRPCQVILAARQTPRWVSRSYSPSLRNLLLVEIGNTWPRQWEPERSPMPGRTL